MSAPTVCASCGKAYSGATCADCEELQRISFLPSLPLVGFIFLLLLLMGFSVTRIAVQSYKAKERTMADQWQNRGRADLSSGKPDAAVEDFENALVYDRENSDYRLQLANALVQAGRDVEAQSHLRNLWDERPGDSLVNLQLARLKARSGDLRGAERYYEGAIYGVWPENEKAYDRRERVRLEFAQTLIRAKQLERAQAQLVSLMAELPSDSDKRKEVGDLLMQAGAPQLAFEQYTLARAHQKGTVALELAEAAFAENNFALSHRWAETAMRESPKSSAAEQLENRTARILSNDPYQTGVGELGRTRRVIKAFHTADARMGACFPTYTLGPNSRQSAGNLGTLPASAMNQVVNFGGWAAQLRPQMVETKLRHRDDVQENAMRFVFQTEVFAAKNCSLPLTDDDKALTLLAKERWSNE